MGKEKTAGTVRCGAAPHTKKKTQSRPKKATANGGRAGSEISKKAVPYWARARQEDPKQTRKKGKIERASRKEQVRVGEIPGLTSSKKKG